MTRFFFKKDSFTKYKAAVINNAVDELIRAIKQYEPTKFEVVYSEEGEYPHYDISAYGVHLFTVYNRQYSVRISYMYDIYNTVVFKYDDICKFDDFNIFYCVTEKDTLTNIINNNVDRMSNRILHGFVNHISKKYNTDLRGKISIDNNYSYVTFGYGLTVNANIIDTRFSEVYKNESSSYEEVKIPHTTAPDQVQEIIDDVVVRVNNKIDTAHNKYNKIKDLVGGVTINLDGKRILCHKSFRPLITGGFINFKCPYTNSIVSMKSTNYNCVIVDGLDEVYGSDDSIVLIGNN